MKKVIDLNFFVHGASFFCLISSSSCLELCSSKASDTAAQLIASMAEGVAEADCALLGPCPHYRPKHGQEFDFVVVGAGSAGAVLANRLTERNWSVLLLEAGGCPTRSTEVPAFFAYVQGTEIDWQYKTDPNEDNCLGMNENRCNWPRGKCLGGSSSLNYMLYVRGNAKDYNKWADDDGCTGWGYKDVLPYFKKSEDMRAAEVLATEDYSEYHGTGGYLKVETWHNREVQPLKDTLASGLAQLGYAENFDCNGAKQSGSVTIQGTLEGGRRCSTNKAFLAPIYGRKNLKISTGSLVTKILIENNTAYGVEFIDRDNNTVHVRARKEVLVSAGAINSPQLLMLSGIGPKDHLESFGITVLADLPVGKNLQDHSLLYLPPITVNFSKPTDTTENYMYDFLMKRTNNRLSSIGLVTKFAFINTEELKKEEDFPDMQMYFLDFNKNDTSLAVWLNIFNFKQEILNKYYKLNSNQFCLLPLGSNLRPYSRGKIELISTDPKKYPKITAGYFSDHRDIETYLRTYDFLSRLVTTDSFKNIEAELHELAIPGCEKYEFASKEYRECSIKHMTATTYHYCSTCKMGPDESTDSVVNPRLKVKGIKNLRVCDAAVMPREISGNINAAVIMIAEKGADLIKEDWPECE